MQCVDLMGPQWSLHPRGLGRSSSLVHWFCRAQLCPGSFKKSMEPQREAGRHWSPGQDPHRCHPAASSGRFTVHLVSPERQERCYPRLQERNRLRAAGSVSQWMWAATPALTPTPTALDSSGGSWRLRKEWREMSWGAKGAWGTESLPPPYQGRKALL